MQETRGLTAWARGNELPASSFTAIGAFSEATLGYYDPDRQEYPEIPVDGRVEVLTLAGAFQGVLQRPRRRIGTLAACPPPWTWSPSCGNWSA